MYATLYDFFFDAFGISLPFLKIANSFGFFVAISFLVTSFVMGLELKRKEKEGLVKGTKYKKTIGEPFPITDYVFSGLFGFLIGFKIINIFFHPETMEHPQDYLLSMQGSWLWGIVIAAISVGWKIRENKKQELPEPVVKDEIFHPYQHMGVITMIALVAGILGAKIFHNLENWSTFIQDPIGELMAFSGLTFYGGLIFGAIGVLWYANKKGIKPLHMLDVGAPSMMLAYCLGRMGCHVSGDGDWGIVNTAPKPG